jgi:hypothetical protein
MSIYYRCRACQSDHRHSISLSYEAFRQLTMVKKSNWFRCWSTCPTQKRIVYLRNEDFFWAD